MAETKDVAKPIDKQVGEFLQNMGQSLKEYALRDYNQSAFLKSAMLAIVENDALKKCLSTEIGKASLFNALRYASTTGLSLNPQEGKSALISYGEKIQYQVMKNGMIDLAMESGKVQFITADYVRENDKFDLLKTASGDSYTFAPALKDRGEILGYYAALTLSGNKTHVKWFTREEVEKHRAKYSSKSAMPETGYGIKTVLKALLRSISISTDLDNAIGADDFYEAEFKVERGVSAADVAAKLAETKPEPKSEQGSLL